MLTQALVSSPLCIWAQPAGQNHRVFLQSENQEKLKGEVKKVGWSVDGKERRKQEKVLLRKGNGK